MAQTVAYIQEHGYDSLDDFHAALNQASDQTSASRKSLKDTEQQLKEVNEQIHFTGQYLAYKNVYADYRTSRNKKKFYEEHRAELSLYDKYDIVNLLFLGLYILVITLPYQFVDVILNARHMVF